MYKINHTRISQLKTEIIKSLKSRSFSSRGKGGWDFEHRLTQDNIDSWDDTHRSLEVKALGPKAANTPKAIGGLPELRLTPKFRNKQLMQFGDKIIKEHKITLPTSSILQENK